MSNAIACFGTTDVQARLISLLSEISGLPDLKNDDDVVIKTTHHQVFWSDLPDWGFQFANAGLCKLHYANRCLLAESLTMTQILRVPQASPQKREMIFLLGYRALSTPQELQRSCCKKAYPPLRYPSKRRVVSSWVSNIPTTKMRPRGRMPTSFPY